MPQSRNIYNSYIRPLFTKYTLLWFFLKLKGDNSETSIFKESVKNYATCVYDTATHIRLSYYVTNFDGRKVLFWIKETIVEWGEDCQRRIFLVKKGLIPERISFDKPYTKDKISFYLGNHFPEEVWKARLKWCKLSVKEIILKNNCEIFLLSTFFFENCKYLNFKLMQNKSFKCAENFFLHVKNKSNRSSFLWFRLNWNSLTYPRICFLGIPHMKRNHHGLCATWGKYL